MKFCEINPFVRFAAYIHYNSAKNKVLVKDCRILYIISGKANLFIENQHFELKPNSLFYCCVGMQYNLESDGIDYLCLNFDLTQRNNTQTAIIPRISVDGTKPLPSVLHPIISDSVFINSYLMLDHAINYVEPLKNIVSEYQTQKVHFREISSGILKMILVQLHRESLNGSQASGHVVDQIISFIRANYNKPINNKIFSDMTGYHEYHLNRLFKEYTGTSLHKYLLNIRINEAQKLLLSTDLSLSAIAEMTGFNSYTHFSNCFKENVELTPKAFRKEFQDKS